MRAIRVLLLLMAAIWVKFAVVSLQRSADGATSQSVGIVVAMLMLGNAAALGLCGWGLGPRPRLLYWPTVALLTLNIVLTFADEFGTWDLITLLIDLAILALLVAVRRQMSSVR